MSRTIPGFDYRTGKPVERTRAEWRDELAAAVRNGGRRRHEAGETFIHGPDARIVAEIYGNVALREADPVAEADALLELPDDCAWIIGLY